MAFDDFESIFPKPSRHSSNLLCSVCAMHAAVVLKWSHSYTQFFLYRFLLYGDSEANS